MIQPAVAAPATAAVCAFALAAILTEVCRRVALRHGVTDRPGAHKKHTRPTPYLGGVALTLACLAPAAAAAGWHRFPAQTVLLTVAGLLIAAIGLADDLLPLGFVSRILVESFAAALVVLGGVSVHLSGNAWLDAGITVAWLVLLTNSFNLLDNMDGAAASMAGPVAAVLGAALLVGGRPDVALLLLCLAGSCAGFLCHNWQPARIFMGDTGSLFLGFVIATGAVSVPPAEPLTTVAVLLLVAFGPLVDTTLVVISRQRAGRPWYLGGTDHVSHRLRRTGLSVGRVCGVMALAGTGFAVLGVLVASGVLAAIVGLSVVLLAGPAAVLLLLKVTVYTEPVSDGVPIGPEHVRAARTGISAPPRP